MSRFNSFALQYQGTSMMEKNKRRRHFLSQQNLHPLMVNQRHRLSAEKGNSLSGFLPNKKDRQQYLSPMSVIMGPEGVYNRPSLQIEKQQEDEMIQKISRQSMLAETVKNENEQLKEQNRYLLDCLRRMKEKEKIILQVQQKCQQYEQLWRDAITKLELVKAETRAYRQLNRQIKAISDTQLKGLEKKLLKVESQKYSPDKISALRKQMGSPKKLIPRLMSPKIIRP